MYALNFSKDFYEFSGPDALRFLGGMLSADLKQLVEHAPSTARAFFLNPKGRIRACFQVLALGPNSFVLALNPVEGVNVIGELEQFLIADDVTVQKVNFAPGGVIEFSEYPQYGKKLLHKNENARDCFYKIIETEEAWVVNKGLLSESHCELYYKKSSAYEKDLDFVQKSEPLEKAYFDSGHPLWGRDFGVDDLPIEYPLQDAFSFDKGCYIGQEVVARGTFRGKPARYWCRFSSLSEKPVLEEGEVLTDSEGHKVGSIKRALGNRALGHIRRTFAEQDALLYVAGDMNREIQWEALMNENTYRR